MSISRQHLHALVDMVEESGLATLYEVMIRFVPEDDETPDEIEAIAEARAEYERGEPIRVEAWITPPPSHPRARAELLCRPVVGAA